MQHALAALAATGVLQPAVLYTIAERLTNLVAVLANPHSSNRGCP